MSQLLDEVAKHRKHIKHEALTFSLSELVNMYLADPREIDIRPDFQRLFRWSRQQQSSFIESLMLEIPIPPLFFFETEGGTWELLDGLQRLSTIIKFMGNSGEVPIGSQGDAGNDDDWHYVHEHDLNVPLQLVSGEYLKSLSGLSFSRLPSQLQLNLKRSRLQIDVLKRETDTSYKYEVFKRLNRGGADLEDQELRNCSIRLLGQQFPQYLQDTAKYAPFLSALGLDSEKTRNGYVEELTLRFFTMKNFGDRFKHDVRDFLTKYMEEVALNRVAFDYAGETAIFNQTWSLISAALPDGEAFRAKSAQRASQGPFSPTLFELVSLGVAWHLDAIAPIPPAELREKIVDLILRAKEEGLTGAGSNSEKKTKGRLALASSWF